MKANVKETAVVTTPSKKVTLVTNEEVNKLEIEMRLFCLNHASNQ